MITNKYVYFKLQKSYSVKNFVLGKIPLSEIKSFHIKSRYSGWMIINGQKKFMLTNFTFLDKRDAKALEELMQRFIDELRTPGAPGYPIPDDLQQLYK
ncbi:MAG: hypothetical protein PHS04_18605 [Tissierellia bacterium]|nr:hypothetical protein [Tissierellia bacterium]